MSALTRAQYLTIAGALGHLARFLDRDTAYIGGRKGNGIDVGGFEGEIVKVRIQGETVEAWLPPAEVDRIVRTRSRTYLASWVMPGLALVLADARDLYATRYRSAAIDLREHANFQGHPDVPLAEQFVADSGYAQKGEYSA